MLKDVENPVGFFRRSARWSASSWRKKAWDFALPSPGGSIVARSGPDRIKWTCCGKAMSKPKVLTIYTMLNLYLWIFYDVLCWFYDVLYVDFMMSFMLIYHMCQRLSYYLSSLHEVSHGPEGSTVNLPSVGSYGIPWNLPICGVKPIKWYAILNHIMPYYAILCHIRPYYAILCHIIPKSNDTTTYCTIFVGLNHVKPQFASHFGVEGQKGTSVWPIYHHIYQSVCPSVVLSLSAIYCNLKASFSLWHLWLVSTYLLPNHRYQLTFRSGVPSALPDVLADEAAREPEGARELWLSILPPKNVQPRRHFPNFSGDIPAFNSLGSGSTRKKHDLKVCW